MKYLLSLATCLLLHAFIVSAQADRICIEDFVLDRDSTLSVPVMLVHETPLRGLQFSITLPDGVKISGYDLTKYSEKYEMNMVCRQADSGNYMVFIYPMSRVCFPSDSAAIMTLDFAANSDFKGGEIILSDVRGSTIDNQSFTLEGDTVTVTVPASSLIGIPIDQSQGNGKFF